MIHTGDAIEVMAQLPENSVDAIVTDPPHQWNFQPRPDGEVWDWITKCDRCGNLHDGLTK